MQTSPESFISKILEIIGINQKGQEKILQAYRNLLFATMVDVIKNALPEKHHRELRGALLKSNDWPEIIAQYAAQIKNHQQLIDEISKRLQKATEQFVGILPKECTPSRHQEIIEHASTLMMLR